MIVGLVTFTKTKLHPPSFIIMSGIHQAMTRLIFVGKVGKLRGCMWLWGANQLVLWVLYNENPIQQHFIFTHNHFRDMTHSILALNLVFISKWPMSNMLMMSSTYTTLNDKRVSPYNTILGSRESLIPKPRSTPSSTPISSISKSLVLILNCQPALMLESMGWVIP